jgi:hypothetical protein
MYVCMYACMYVCIFILLSMLHYCTVILHAIMYTLVSLIGDAVTLTPPIVSVSAFPLQLGQYTNKMEPVHVQMKKYVYTLYRITTDQSLLSWAVWIPHSLMPCLFDHAIRDSPIGACADAFDWGKGDGWIKVGGFFLSLPGLLSVRKNSLSGGTHSEFDQGPASRSSVCRCCGWTARAVCVGGHTGNLCLVIRYLVCCLLSFFEKKGGAVVPFVPHPRWPGESSFRVGHVCY